MVLWHHLGQDYLFGRGPNPLDGLWTGTWHGVELFFTVSGFVVSASLIAKLDAGGAGGAITRFYIRRVFRLFPTCFLWLGLAWLATAALFPGARAPGAEMSAIVFYVHNIFLRAGGRALFPWYWSLSIEEQFYLLFPLFLLVVRKNSARAAVVLAYALGVALLLPLPAVDSPAAEFLLLRASSVRSFVPILLGVLLFLARARAPRVSGAAGRGLNAALLAALVAVPALIPTDYRFKFLAIDALCAALVLLAASGEGPFTPLPALDALLERIGRRSYILYLAQIPVFYAVRALGPGVAPAGLLLAAAAALAAATELTYRFLEQPMIRLGARVADRAIS